jgi:penicillin-binding protein activator
MKISILGIVLVAVAFLTLGCGSRQYSKGEYKDPNVIILLTDKFSENDLQLIAKKISNSILESTLVKGKDKRPVFAIERVTNKTSEHIDMESLTDKIKVELIQSGRVLFSDKGLRENVAQEIEYQGSKYVDPSTAKQVGKQVGADYLLTGNISSIVQEAGKNKLVYYKSTFNLTNLSTNLIEWSDEKELRKAYKKRYVGY